VQTFLNLNSSDKEIIYSLENDIVIQSLEKRIKYLIIYGPNKSGKTTIAKKFSINNNINLINNIHVELNFNKETYLDLNNLPGKDENFFHFLQFFVSNNIPLTIFTSENSIENLSNDFYLPDVVSRLKQFNLCNIQNPSKDLLLKLINKYLSLKSISVPEEIIIEVMNYIERTYLSAFEAANTINHLLYENNHNINLSLIRKHYERL
jgi:predicted AAA+ superfamily ATPase